MKGNTCLLVHHRSLWGTISIGVKEKIKFYSWTSTNWEIRSTVTWRSTSCWIFQTNPIQTQSNLWSNGERNVFAITTAGWEHWTVRNSRRGTEIAMQNMPDALGRWHRLLHVWTLLSRRHNWKQEMYLVRVGSLHYPEFLHQERPATRSQVREEGKLQRTPHGKTTSKGVSKETLRKHSRSICPWHVVQKNDDRVGSLWRSHPWNGQTCKRKPRSYCHTRRNWFISWQSVDPFEFGGFRHDADKASTWLQENAVDFASPTENEGQSALWKLVANFLFMVAMANYLVASPIMRPHHKDGLNTDRTGKPV